MVLNYIIYDKIDTVIKTTYPVANPIIKKGSYWIFYVEQCETVINQQGIKYNFMQNL